MKMKQFALIFLVALTLVGCGVTNQATDSNGKKLSKAEKEAAITNQVIDKINNRHFTIDVDYMTPMRGRMRRSVQNFSLEIKGDTVRSYLPYIGDVYRSTYGTQKALNFDGMISNYSVQQVSNDLVRILFLTSTEEDNYQYQLEIYINGKTYIHVNAQNRDGIDFDGEMQLQY